MSKFEELASQNASETTNVANVAASNEFNNIEKMKQEIDWSALMGSTAVAQPKTIDPQVVTDIFTSFLSIPTEVNVGFKNEAGYLKMTVSMNFREKFIRNFETLADYKLVACTVAAMGGTIPAPEGYLAEEHKLEASDVDPREDLFVQFLNSPFRCHIEPDFVSAKGERFFCASFAPGYRKVVRFCLKRTPNLEEIIKTSIYDAVHSA
jgi:hypothetical protein